MSSRQDAVEERLSSLEDKMQGLQEQLEALPELITRCLTQHHERVDQRRNFLHPDAAAASTIILPTPAIPSPIFIPHSSASLDDLKIVVVNENGVDDDMKRNIINGNSVYLCRTMDDATDDNMECYGIGIVRAVGVGNSKVYLLPAIPLDDLKHVNTLAVCSIPLPTAILINQSSMTGYAPYVYCSDNFIGSKQIVPISYRPDKHVTKNNTQN